MVDFYEENFNFKFFIYFLAIGFFLLLISYPISLFFHSIGHGLFGTLAGCQFIGVYLPIDKHSNAVLNYPNAFFSGTKKSIIYWLGGHLFLIFILFFILFYPSGPSILEMAIRETLGFYFSFFGGFLETIFSIQGEEAQHLPDVLKVNKWFFIIFLSFVFLFFSFFFIYRLINFFGRSFKESILVPFFLSLSFFYLPVLIFLLFLYFYKGFNPYFHLPIFIFSSIFLISAPLIPRGNKIWVLPDFFKTIYGLFLFSTLTVLLYYFLFLNKKFPLLLWGKVSIFCNLPLEVEL